MLRWIEQPRDGLDDRTADDVVARILADLGARGWRVVYGRALGVLALSQTFAPARTLYLYDWESRDTWARAVLLAHEATHVRQLDGPLWRRCWRLAAYALPWVRWRVEVEAVAHTLVMLRSASSAAREARRYDLASLTGWRWPYYTGAREATVRARLLARVEALGG